jgi:hypothetical protein
MRSNSPFILERDAVIILLGLYLKGKEGYACCMQPSLTGVPALGSYPWRQQRELLC